MTAPAKMKSSKDVHSKHRQNKQCPNSFFRFFEIFAILNGKVTKHRFER